MSLSQTEWVRFFTLREGEGKGQAKGVCLKKYFSVCPKDGKIKLP
jgi:hypothetical protein